MAHSCLRIDMQQLMEGRKLLNMLPLGVSRSMPMIRVQYNLRKINKGIDAWNVERLIDLSKDLPIKMIDPKAIADFYGNHWYFHEPELVSWSTDSLGPPFRRPQNARLRYQWTEARKIRPPPRQRTSLSKFSIQLVG